MSTLINNNAQENQVAQTALIVDDQPICLAILERLLENKNITVDTAANGKTALALWQTKQHQIVITDCHMPTMDGYTLATAIREIEQAENQAPCKIVALSASTSEEDQQRCLSAGINEVVNKPINSQQIDALLSGWQITSNVQAGNSKPIVDFSILEQIFPDAHKQLEILTGFETHIQDDYSALQAHAAQDDLAAVENTAHRMKGSSRMVGVDSIASLCATIESNAKNGRIAGSELLAKLNENIQAFSSYLVTQSQSNTSVAKQGGIE